MDRDEAADPHWHPVARTPSTESHCMNNSLYDYILPKIHTNIIGRDWAQIRVIGLYSRSPPTRITATEKRRKPFNWHRPTATEIASDVVQLNCFPGADYVQHYACLVATYLAMTKKDPSIVRYQIPTESDRMRSFVQSNLKGMGKADIVVIGNVHQLRRFQSGCWYGREAEGDKIFGWQKFRSDKGRWIALLGCMPSFWGDISGYLVHALQQMNQVKCILYIGKTGSLRPEDSPNECIATGSSSHIGRRLIRWRNVLKEDLRLSTKIAEGDHVTVRSPLCESLSWLEKWQSKCRWADCEVGHIADASNEGGTEFGYLHIVSDNIARAYPQNLSNEHLEAVIASRRLLFDDMEEILESFFARWDSNDGTKSE
jgi:hypothetical protein